MDSRLHGNDGSARESGFGLIELIATMVIISVAGIGIVTAMGVVANSAALPVQRVQAMALAETLMAEIMRQPFSFCDPDDSQFSTATSTAACTGGTSASQDPATLTGPMPVSESRGNTDAFDNISDYAGLSMNPVVTMDGQSWPGFSATVAVQRTGAAFLTAADGEVLRITVTVNAVAADGVVLDSIVLDGYRSRHAPNSGQPVL